MKRTHRLLRALMLALVACLLIAASPLSAFADDKDYDLASTRVWATVGTDGVVHVSEVRTIDLDGNFHGFYWEIDTKRGELDDVSVRVTAAGEVINNNLTPYDYVGGSSDAEGTWTMEERSNYTRVDVHYDKYDERASFYVNYDLTGVTAKWADTGELYWKYGSATSSLRVPPRARRSPPERTCAAGSTMPRWWAASRFPLA